MQMNRRTFLTGVLATPLVAKTDAIWVPPRRIIQPFRAGMILPFYGGPMDGKKEIVNCKRVTVPVLVDPETQLKAFYSTPTISPGFKFVQHTYEVQHTRDRGWHLA